MFDLTGDIFIFRIPLRKKKFEHCLKILRDRNISDWSETSPSRKLIRKSRAKSAMVVLWMPIKKDGWFFLTHYVRGRPTKRKRHKVFALNEKNLDYLLMLRELLN